MMAVTNWPSTSVRSGLGMVARMIRLSVRLVDLRVGQVPGAARRIFLAVGQAQADVDLGQAAIFLAARFADRLEVLHADREQHVDRILADDGREDAARRVHEVALGVDGAADAAVDRAPDVGVVEVRLGLDEGGTGLLDRAGRRVEIGLGLVEHRLRRVLPLHQVELAAVLQLGVGLRGLGDQQIALGLVERRLELHLLDLVEQVARLDVLAFGEQHLVEEALDARPHLDLVHRLDAAGELERAADAALS